MVRSSSSSSSSSRRLTVLIAGVFYAASISFAFSQNVEVALQSCEAQKPPVLLSAPQLLERIDRCNPDVVLARRAVAAANADQQVALERPNPNMTVGIGYINPLLGLGAGSLPDKTVDSSIRLEQLIERAGKPQLRRKIADRSADASRLDLSEIVRQQHSAALLVLIDLAAATRRAEILDEIVHFYAETERANARRSVSGDLAPINAQRQAVEATRSRADLQQTKSDMKRAQIALSVLLAWEPFAQQLIADTVVLDPPDPSKMTAEQFDPNTRPSVRALLARAFAAQASVDLAKAQSKADVTLGFQFDHFPQSAANPTGSGNTYAFSLGIPLLVRHAFEGEVTRATSDAEGLSESVQRARAAALSEWMRLNTDLTQSTERFLLLSDIQTPQAEKVARAAEFGYAKGALGILELLDARRLLRQTRLDLLAARADVARSKWLMRLFMQTSSEEIP